MVAVERPIVETLGFEKDDRVVVLYGGDQQTFCIVRIGRDDRLKARDMGKQGFGALAVGLDRKSTRLNSSHI